MVLRRTTTPPKALNVGVQVTHGVLTDQRETSQEAPKHTRQHVAYECRNALGVITMATHQPLKASDHTNNGKYHLLLAATGSVAAIKIPDIVTALSERPNLSIRVLLSKSAAEFLRGQSAEQPSLDQIARLRNVDAIYQDIDEWRKPWVRGDSILHIELRKWADMMVIAPLSANSLAKVALGLSDDLVSSVVRAWDTSGMVDAPRNDLRKAYGDKKLIMVAPAMNTAMWAHPITASHMKVLTGEWSVEHGGWIQMLRPIEKELACGDTGSGAMCDWKDIVAAIDARFSYSKKTTNGTTANGLNGT